MRKCWMIFYFLSLPLFAQLQEGEFVRENVIEQLIEAYSENAETEIDYTILVDDLNYYFEEPLNLNTATRDQMYRLLILNDEQINELLNYRKRYGNLLSLYELQHITGWDERTIALIQPFVSVQKAVKVQRFKTKSMFLYGKNDFILRYAQNLEETKGYESNNGYLGSPFLMQFRYRFTYKNKVSWGLTAQKDRGEEFFTGTQKQGFDYYSAHFFVRDVWKFKTIALGDYQLQFGQGLTVWTGFGARKSSFVNNVRRQPLGIKPYTGTSNFLLKRGAAFELEVIKDLSVAAFVSYKNLDGRILEYDSLAEEVLSVSSLIEIGYHRTKSEFATKNTLTEFMAGGNITYKRTNWKIGTTVNYTQYSAAILPDWQPYNTYYFRGKEQLNAGLDYTIFLKSVYLFGEVSISKNLGYAVLQGVQLNILKNLSLTMVFRDYGRNYINNNNNVFSDRGAAQNERGFYVAFEASPWRKFQFMGFVDVIQFPWLRFGVNAPSWSYDIFGQMTFLPASNFELVVRARHRMRQENTSQEMALKKIIDVAQTNLRLHYTYSINKQFKMRGRVETILLDHPEKEFRWGYLIYQDIIYKLKQFPLAFSARFALFDTPDYDTRLFAYENDVLYSFSVPAYYYRGIRTYLMIQIEPVKNLTCWLRFGQFYYMNRSTIGTALEEIDGNTKTEFKVQIRYRFSFSQLKKKKIDEITP